jgi:leucine dehydrogenase
VRKGKAMKIADSKPIGDYERIVRACDRESGLKAIVAIHNTRRGPALGGCRMWSYASEAEALEDALRLAHGMTYKNALADLPFGGGKSVIIADKKTHKSEALLRSMGKLVQSLNGTYTIAEDVGTTPKDMAVIREETPFVAGLPDGGSGDPSPATAWGVYQGIKAAMRERLGHDDLTGVRVAVQGLGNVGWNLAQRLSDAGAVLLVSDIHDSRMSEAQHTFGATPVPAYRIYDAPTDIFAPCALGAIINDDTLPRLKAKIVAGSANNQLAEDRHGIDLKSANILYAPDYAINAGGVINIYYEYCGTYDRDTAFKHIAGIGDTLSAIFKRARRLDIPTNAAANHIAEDRFRALEAA